MLEKTHSFGIRNISNDEIQKIMEDYLQKNFNFSTKTSQLGKTLIRINYFDENIDEGLQKDNKITILKEPEKKVYIKINGKLPETQIFALWKEMEEKLKTTEKQEEKVKKPPTKDEIIYKIIKKIQVQGYNIKKIDAEFFMENFQEKYVRLPKKDEINSIVNSYIRMINEGEVINRDYNTEPLYEEHSINIDNNNFKESQEVLVKTKSRIPMSLYSYENGIIVIEKPLGRRKCPSCGNEGLIHELDDKTLILLDYPRIYGKKCCCAECGQEWREI